MTRTNAHSTITTNPQGVAEAAEAERRRDFIERMEQKLRSKELAYAARHGYVKDIAH